MSWSQLVLTTFPKTSTRSHLCLCSSCEYSIISMSKILTVTPAFVFSSSSLIVFSSVTRIVNSSFFIRYQHRTRIMFVTGCIVASFLIIAICCFYESISAMFYLSLFASIVVGVGCALGESVNLGFLKTFPGNTIGYYGSGTGFAGMSGSLIFIALTPLGLSDGAIYLIALPTAIPYLLCFFWLNR